MKKSRKYIILIIIVIILIAIAIYLFKKPRPLTLREKIFKNVPIMYNKRLDKISDDTIDSLIEQYYDARKSGDTSVIWGFKWAGTESSIFSNLLNTLEPILPSIADRSSRHFKDGKTWRFIQDILGTILAAIPMGQSFVHTFPFGNNWYPFSITLLRILGGANFFYYDSFGELNDKLMDSMNRTVILLLPTPRKSLGYTRNGANAVMMLTPFIIAHTLMGDWDKLVSHADVQETILDVLNIPTNRSIGLYPDGAFLFHNTNQTPTGDEGYLRAFGYLTSAYTEYDFLNKVFDCEAFMYNSQRVFDKLFHPVIPLHFPSWFSRTTNLKHNPSKFAGRLGMHILDSIKAISILSDNFVLQFNGQTTHLSFCEVDRNHSQLPAISLFMRRMLYADTPEHIQVIHVPYYPGVVTTSLIPLTLKVEKYGQTTCQYFMNTASTHIVHLPGSGRENPYIAMSNYFSFDQQDMNFHEVAVANHTGLYSYIRDCSGSNNEYVRSVGYGKKIKVLKVNEKYLIDDREVITIHKSGEIMIYKLRDINEVMKKIQENANQGGGTDVDADSNLHDIARYTRTHTYEGSSWTGPKIISGETKEENNDSDSEDTDAENDATDDAEDKEIYYSIVCKFCPDDKCVSYSAIYGNDGDTQDKFMKMTYKDDKMFTYSLTDCTVTLQEGWLSAFNTQYASFANDDTKLSRYTRLPLVIFQKHKSEYWKNSKNIRICAPPDPEITPISINFPEHLVKPETITPSDYYTKLYAGQFKNNYFEIRNNYFNSRITLEYIP